ncbi:MAG: radical SAM protein [Candidatus Wallbacteria bacterium]|nr:radical SAM protein [Candidatus Wallbacteria bacterium]
MKIIPFFLPELGCRHSCIYCNQRLITGTGLQIPDIIPQLKAFLCSVAIPAGEFEFAFYGGTFTALPEELINGMLGTVTEFFKGTSFRGIRFSTRPDELSEKILELVFRFPVSTVELGVQSFDDQVLGKIGRGYSAEILPGVVENLRRRRTRVGVQLMIGLPAETRRTHRLNLSSLKNLNPDFLRIYPLLVLKGTELEDIYQKGGFTPLSLKQAILSCQPYLELEKITGIRIIRLGLKDEPGLSAGVIAGPHHPSFGELCRTHYFLRRIQRFLRKKVGGTFIVNPADIQYFLGYRRSNYLTIFHNYNFQLQYIADMKQPRGILKLHTH